MPEISELEFALTVANNGFQRWVVRCMAAAGYGDLSQLEVLILHVVFHRSKTKRMADICLMLNLEDVHTVSYALKKLEKAGLVRSFKQGKEKMVEVTPRGAKACKEYRQIRERCLIGSLEALNLDTAEVSKLAGLLRTLSGIYDQASRSATSL